MRNLLKNFSIFTRLFSLLLLLSCQDKKPTKLFYALPASDVEWRAFEARFGGRLIEGYGRSKTFGDLHIEPGFVRGDQAALHRVAGAGAAGPGGG